MSSPNLIAKGLALNNRPSLPRHSYRDLLDGALKSWAPYSLVSCVVSCRTLASLFSLVRWDEHGSQDIRVAYRIVRRIAS